MPYPDEMLFFQCPDLQYPGMTRFVCHTNDEDFAPVLVWLNDMIPGDFVVIKSEEVGPNEFYPSHWEEIYIGQASNAALFKLTWDTIKP